jgi:uncharacterized RDD family membrane protein YckC
MPIIQIATPFNIELEFETAGAAKRLLAYLADFTLLLLYFIGMKYFYYGTTGHARMDVIEENMGLDILTISLPMLMYSLVCEVLMHGQTIGKKLLDIRVISLDGNEPSLSQYITRWMFKAFEWPFFFGYTILSSQTLFGYVLITGFLGLLVVLAIAITPKKRRLGDLAANTAVVNTRSAYTVDDTIFVDVPVQNYEVAFPEVLKLSDRDINTIKNVIDSFYTSHRSDTCERVTAKICEVLIIKTDMYPIDFLEKLLADYNYLATK